MATKLKIVDEVADIDRLDGRLGETGIGQPIGDDERG
jgi:hypothetical protein